MADDDTNTQTAPSPPPDLSGLPQDVLANALKQLLGPQQPVVATSSPSTSEGRSVLSLLGEGLGGGAQYGTTGERETGGLAALGSFGQRLMAAGDYSYHPHTLGSMIAQGYAGAQDSLASSQAVSAARQTAAQQYQQEQSQNQIQRLKAALPLLSLQAQMNSAAAARGIVSGNQNGPPSTNIGTGGSIGQVNVPPEYLPFYQAASARTGIPVETLIAQSRQESGFNPNATGKAGEIGIAQVMPATAKDPGFGMAPVDPKALRDPETAINFQADYLKAHLPKGADPTDPVAIAKALQGYNGGGDPNYVANVNRYLPGARAALAPPPRPGNQPPAASPPPVPGTVAPPVVGARPVLPPPQPAIAPNAGAQVAGPAAPTSGVIPPSPPGSAGDVAAIRGGMIGAGANPVTLAPGQGSAPAPQGATVVAGTPQPPTPPTPTTLPPIKAGDGLITHPGTYAEYRAREYVPPPAGAEDFNPNLTPAQQAEFAAEGKSIEGRASLLGTLPLAEQPKAASDIVAARADLQAKIQAATQAKAAAAAANTTKYNENQDAAIRPRYEKEADAYAAAAQSNLTSQQKIAEQASQSGFDINKAGREVSFKTDTETLKNLATNASVAASVNPQLEQLGTVTPGALPPGITASIVKAHPNLVPFLTQLGALTPEQATDTQLMQGMTNMLSTELRPKGSGRLLLPEIDAFKSDLPNLLQQPGGRIKAAAFLKNLNDRSQEESDFANQYFKRIDPATGQPAFNLDGLPKALAQPRSAGGLGPIVPPMPPLATLTGDPAGPAAAATNWLKQNVEVGRPYMGWQYPLNPRTQQPDPTQPPELHLMVREK